MQNKKRNITIAIIVAILLFLLFLKKKAQDAAANGGGGAASDENDYSDFMGRHAVKSTTGSELTANPDPTYAGTKSSQIYLQLQNTTTLSQTVTLFDFTNKYNQQSLTPNYNSFDLTTELAAAAIYSSNVLVLVVSQNNGAYQTLFYTKPSGYYTTAAQVAADLNTLNVGVFTNTVGNIVTVSASAGESFGSISITNIYTGVAQSSGQYSRYGSLIYNTGFAQNGTGTFTRINTSNAFWINTALDTVSGAMNRNGVWNNAIPSGQPIGGTFTYQSNTALQVYVGIAGDDDFDFYLNGQLIVNYDIAANIIDIQTQLGITTSDPSYQCWSIYPVALQVGNNLFQFYNKNIIAPPSAIGVEVYNNTAAQIAAATSYAGLNVLYRTSTLVGGNLY